MVHVRERGRQHSIDLVSWLPYCFLTLIIFLNLILHVVCLRERAGYSTLSTWVSWLPYCFLTLTLSLSLILTLYVVCVRERGRQHSIDLGHLAPLLLSNAHSLSLSHPHPVCGVCERERETALYRLGLLAPLLLSNAHSLSHPHPACGVFERERETALYRLGLLAPLLLSNAHSLSLLTLHVVCVREREGDSTLSTWSLGSLTAF